MPVVAVVPVVPVVPVVAVVPVVSVVAVVPVVVAVVPDVVSDVPAVVPVVGVATHEVNMHIVIVTARTSAITFFIIYPPLIFSFAELVTIILYNLQGFLSIEFVFFDKDRFYKIKYCVRGCFCEKFIDKQKTTRVARLPIRKSRSDIRLGRVLLLRSDIRLAPSDICFAS